MKRVILTSSVAAISGQTEREHAREGESERVSEGGERERARIRERARGACGCEAGRLSFFC